MSVPTPWLPHARGRADAALRLVCFPHAGGSAARFRRWSDGLPAAVEVCAVELPGRGSRAGEAPFDDVRALAAGAAAALGPWLDRPYALVGHSVGALAAFEVARRLRRDGHRAPAALLVAAFRAPSLPRMGTAAGDGSADELLERLRRLGGTPAEVLAEPELVRAHARALRADFALSQSYTYTPEPPLEAPIHAFAGASDPVTPAATMRGWQAETRGAFTLRRIPGGHFFVDEAAPLFLRLLAHHLRPLGAARAPRALNHAAGVLAGLERL